MPLHCATASGSIECVELLLQSRAGIVDSFDCKARTPLHLAVEELLLSTAALLLEYRASAHSVNHSGGTPIHTAVERDHPALLQLLIHPSAGLGTCAEGVLDTHDWRGHTPLHMAAALGHQSTLAELICRRASLTATDVLRSTPLHLAAQKGHADVAAALLQKGASVNVTGSRNRTPLHWAAAAGDHSTVSVLLEARADFSAVDSGGNKAKDLASQMGARGEQAFELLLACKAGQAEMQEAAAEDEQSDPANAPMRAMVGRIVAASRMQELCTVKSSPAAPPPHGSPSAASLPPAEVSPSVALAPPLVAAVVATAATSAQASTCPVAAATDDAGCEKVSPSVPLAPPLVAAVVATAATSAQASTCPVAAAATDDAGCEKAGALGGGAGGAGGEGVVAAKPAAQPRHPLLAAASKGNEDAMRHALGKLAPNERIDDVFDSGGHTVVHLAVLRGDTGILQLLLDAQASPSAPSNKRQMPLHLASSEGHAQVIDVLLQHGAPVNVRDCKGQTPLHRAAYFGSMVALTQLMTQGHLPALNAADDRGRTPLHWAAHNGNLIIVSSLLQLRAEANTQDAAGRLPVSEAVHQDHGDCALMLLGGDGKAATSGLLQDAVIAGHCDIITMLVEANAELNAQCARGLSPLHTAVGRGQTAMVRHILELRADANLRIRAASEKGWTALHWATSRNDTKTMGVLLEYGASQCLCDEQGHPPKTLAELRGNTSALGVLTTR
eukprot:NODE_24_length_4262_cov_7.566626.p1 GENE.NODE_24_length_4262_cov_7.566626~~NODE_24_length_4262_cov_7.566626.p1  ORF type:complete len:728 (+),score=191.03 NODE_24_length_4262_cov_7.566626:2030-4213(+)